MFNALVKKGVQPQRTPQIAAEERPTGATNRVDGKTRTLSRALLDSETG